MLPSVCVALCVCVQYEPITTTMAIPITVPSLPFDIIVQRQIILRCRSAGTQPRWGMLVDCASSQQTAFGGWEGACGWRLDFGLCGNRTLLGKLSSSGLRVSQVMCFIKFLISLTLGRWVQHTTKENEQSIVNASFHVTHWSVQPYGTGISRMKYVGYVFGGDVLRFFHGGDECLTIPSTWGREAGQK